MNTLPFYVPLVFGVSIVLALYLFYRASGRSRGFLLPALAWITLQGFVSWSGFYAAPGKPLRFPLLVMPPVVLGLIYSYTPKGRRFFSTLDVRSLTLLQSIRLLVEPVLYWLALYHLVPRAMTFEGKNFDILTGLTMPIIYYFGFVRRTLPTWLMILWNWMGIGLLAVVVSIGVSSALNASQTFVLSNAGEGLSSFAIQHFPWALLPGFLVPTAFFAHVGSIRCLTGRRPADNPYLHNQIIPMSTSSAIFREPDLSARPHRLAVERQMQLPPATLYKAWTVEFDRWFAAPGCVLMTGEVDTPFFFETEYSHSPGEPPKRHPHYGRFLALVPDCLIRLTWLTGAPGTKGAETVVTVELIPNANGTLLKLTHAGFPDQESMKAHRQAWPMVLELLERSYIDTRDLR